MYRKPSGPSASWPPLWLAKRGGGCAAARCGWRGRRCRRRRPCSGRPRRRPRRRCGRRRAGGRPGEHQAEQAPLAARDVRSRRSSTGVGSSAVLVGRRGPAAVRWDGGRRWPRRSPGGSGRPARRPRSRCARGRGPWRPGASRPDTTGTSRIGRRGIDVGPGPGSTVVRGPADPGAPGSASEVLGPLAQELSASAAARTVREEGRSGRRPAHRHPSEASDVARPRRGRGTDRAHRGGRMRPSWTTVTASCPVVGVHRAPGEAPAPGGRRGVLGVEEPLVGPERAVEPHGVVEAGHEHVVDAARGRGGAARCRAGSCPTRRSARRRAAPGRRAGCRWPAARSAGRAAGAVRGRPGPSRSCAGRSGGRRSKRVSPRSAAMSAHRSWMSGSVSGVGDLGHRLLVVEAVLGDLERGGEAEDGPPVLDRR